MSDTAQLGLYQVQADARGLWLMRDDTPAPGGTRALLTLRVVNEDGAAAALDIHRISQPDDGSLVVSGSMTELVQVEARLLYRGSFDGMELEVELVNASADMRVRLEVSLELVGEADPHWLIPGLFYNDNRPRDCQRVFPAYSEIKRDPARFLSNHWSFRSDRAAMPVVFCTTFSACGFLATHETMGATERNPLGFGTTSIGFGSEEGYPSLTCALPYHEEPVKYSYSHADRTDPVETFVRLEKNTFLRFSAKLGFQPIRDGGFDAAWGPVYRALYEEYWPVHDIRPRLSSVEVEREAMGGLLAWHLDEETGMVYESAAFDKNFGSRGTNTHSYTMHCGWRGGAVPAYTMLWLGRDKKDGALVRQAQKVFDRITAKLTPAGTLWPTCDGEEGEYAAGWGPEGGLAHSRTIAEAAVFILRALRLDLQANTSHPDWFNALRSTMEFIIGKQREDGALPDYWKCEDGTPTGFNSAAGIAWIVPLVGFFQFTSDPRFRRAAVAAGEYYSSFINDDFIHGSVEDQPLTPTADDAHMAFLAMMQLYELEREDRWLKLARRAALIATTFRFAYNVTFHPATMLGTAKFRTRGGDVYSVATPYISPTGLLSYGEMVKLSAITGDPYFAARAREARTFATQLVARIDGEYNARRGMALGQVFHTDWWQPKGMCLTLSHSQTLALLAYVELLERYVNIPTMAIEGDVQEILDQSKSATVVLQEEIVLPDPVEVRRRQDLREGSSKSGRASATELSFLGAAGSDDDDTDPASFVSHLTSRMSDVLGLQDEGPGLGAGRGPSRPPAYDPQTGEQGGGTPGPRPADVPEHDTGPVPGGILSSLLSGGDANDSDYEDEQTSQMQTLRPEDIQRAAGGGAGQWPKARKSPPERHPSSYDDSDSVDESGPVPSHPTPPAGGLLAGLFDDDNAAVPPPRPITENEEIPSFDMRTPAPGPAREDPGKGDEEPEEEDSEVKWKIF